MTRTQRHRASFQAPGRPSRGPQYCPASTTRQFPSPEADRSQIRSRSLRSCCCRTAQRRCTFIHRSLNPSPPFLTIVPSTVYIIKSSELDVLKGERRSALERFIVYICAHALEVGVAELDDRSTGAVLYSIYNEVSTASRAVSSTSSLFLPTICSATLMVRLILS